MNDYIEDLIAKFPTPAQERGSYLYNDLKTCFSPDTQFTFLDMGAGSGSMSAIILSQFQHSRGELVDVVSRLKMHEFVPNIDENRFVQHPYPATEQLSGKEFDLVLSMDVLEHIPDWKTALHGLFQYVRPNGYLYIQTPSNYPSPSYPATSVYLNYFKGFFGKNNPANHVRHGLSCKSLLDICSTEFTPIVAAEDYVVNGKVFCSFKPRTHLLLKKIKWLLQINLSL